jgi:hypothetical protein
MPARRSPSSVSPGAWSTSAAIVAGTAVFILNRTIAPWLIAKLALVALLVVCHALTGMLIMRMEANKVHRPRTWWWVLAGTESLLMLGILWLVLAKPARRPPMALAETASIFCETLVVEEGLSRLDGADRLDSEGEGLAARLRYTL